ncbi:MAG TPA: N-6 DNA methylase [Drouetiella sp.]
MKTPDKFRILKRSVENALKFLSSEKPTSPKFPDSEFVLCILLVAIRVLAARKHLPKLELSAQASLFEQAQHLLQIVNSCCHAPVKIETKLRQNDAIEKAFAELDKNSLEVLKDDLTISYAYQFLSMSARKQAQSKVQTANKEHSVEDLIAFTQLYTPDWVVNFLTSNAVGNVLPGAGTKDNFADGFAQSVQSSSRIRARSGCHKGTIGNPFGRSTQFGKWSVHLARGSRSSETRQLRILDPACGAGNFLARAMELMIQIHIQSGIEKNLATELAIEQNIFGVDLDPAAAWISVLTLFIKSIEHLDFLPKAKFNIYLASENDEQPLLGSLDRTFSEKHILSQKYDVVLMNPPYIGRKLMSRELKTALKANYPNSHSDICTGFMERSLELLKPGGALGVITQSSMLTLPSYGELRREILSKHNLQLCVDAGTHVFPLQGGDKVNSVMLVIVNNPASEADRATFFDLRQSDQKTEYLAMLIEKHNDARGGPYYKHPQSVFLQERESAIKYACPQIVLQLTRNAAKLEDIADVRQGLATTNNDRFIRLIDDVPTEELGVKWFPYVKGAGSDRWFSPVKHVVNWHNNGEEIKAAVNKAYPYLNGNIKWVVKNEQFYFRDGLCFSFVNTGRLAVRKLPAGCIFDVGASALFVTDKEDENFLLAYLNSALIGAIASAMNPTINFQVGDIKALPLFPIDDSEKKQLSALASECCKIKEASYGADNKNSAQSKSLAEIENDINSVVFEAFCKNFALTAEQRTEVLNWIKTREQKVNSPGNPLFVAA